MTDKDFRSLMRGLDEARRYTAGEDVGCVVHYNIDFGDYLPDEEVETPHLLEECPPELLVIDEADYGDE